MSKEHGDLHDALIQSDLPRPHDPEAAYSNGVVIVYDAVGDSHIVVKICGGYGHGRGSYWHGLMWHAGTLESCEKFLPREPG